MLYVFGDSFSHTFNEFNDANELRKSENLYPQFIHMENNWVDLVAEKLTGKTDQINDSISGAANEFIFHRYFWVRVFKYLFSNF